MTHGNCSIMKNEHTNIIRAVSTIKKNKTIKFPLVARLDAYLTYLHTQLQWPVSLCWLLGARWRVGPTALPVSLLHVQVHLRTLMFAASESHRAQHAHKHCSKWGMKEHKWDIIQGHGNWGTPLALAAHTSAGLTVPDHSLEESELTT